MKGGHRMLRNNFPACPGLVQIPSRWAGWHWFGIPTTAVVALFQVGGVRSDFELTSSPSLSSGSAGVGVANSTA